MTPETRAALDQVRRGLLMAVMGLDKLLESAQQANDMPAPDGDPAQTKPASGRLRAKGGRLDLRRL